MAKQEGDLVELLRSHEGDLWNPESSGMPENLLEVERRLGVSFPEGYRQLLAYSDGGALYGESARVLLFSSRDLLEFNPDPNWSPGLPGMVIFGHDEGDHIYYFDPEDRLGRGAWTIYAVGMGAPDFDFSIYVADDISHLFRRILEGESILDAPYLMEEREQP